MNHRTLSLATSISSNAIHHAPSTSLTPLLQAAAGRAWNRRMSVISFRTRAANALALPTLGLKSPSSSSHCYCTRRNVSNYVSPSYHHHNQPDVVHQQPKSLPSSHDSSLAQTQPVSLETGPAREALCAMSNSTPLEQRPCKANSPSHDADVSSLERRQQHRNANTVRRRSSGTPLPRPTTYRALFRNLLYLSRVPTKTPSLPALLDYHDLFPSLHSTRSCNFLIALAIRHAAYGTVRTLLQSMSHTGIPMNLETQKLRTRWLIEMGWWSRAWEEAVRDTQQNSVKTRGIPLVIWLEFFRTTKRGAIKAPNRNQNQNRRQEDAETTGPTMSNTDLNYKRFRFLMENLPSLTAQEMATIPTRTMYWIIMLILKSNQPQMGLSMTEFFFRQLPAKLSKSQVKTCLDIIHLHIAFGMDIRACALFNAARRTITSLLALHRSFRPNATTLFLLLGTLRKSKRCGTIAFMVLRQFKRKWGDTVEDPRVRRRIISLALKEKRPDIVEQLLRSETSLPRPKKARKTTQVQIPRTRSMHKPSSRVMFRRKGRERYLLRKRLRFVHNRRRADGMSAPADASKLSEDEG